MEILVSAISAAAIGLFVFVGATFGSTIVESKIRRGLNVPGPNEVVSVNPGRNEKPFVPTEKAA